MSIRLVWSDINSTEDGHEVYRSESPIDPESLPSPLATLGANVTLFDDTGAEQGVEYFYRVAAIRGDERAISSELVFTAEPDVLLDEYLDAAELVHDWSNLTGWTTTGVQASSNRLYGISGGNPVATGKAFAVPAGGVCRVTAEVVEVNPNTGSRYVGVSFGGSNDGVNASLPAFIGAGLGGSTRLPQCFIGSTFSGVTTGQVIMGTAQAAGTYRVTVTIDEVSISLVISKQDGSAEWSHIIPRSAAPNGGAITSVIVWNGATSGLSGGYVKAIGAKASLTPFRTKSNAAGAIEGNTAQVIRRNEGDQWRIQLPAVGNGAERAPIVVFMHQASTGNQDSPWSEARMLPVAQALSAAGYILVSAADGGDRWGNSASLANYAALVAWVRAHYYTGKALLLGPSMGGAPMFNAIVRGSIPGVVGAAGICSVCDLDAMYADTTFKSAIRTAYGATTDAEFVANSAGWSPNDNLGAAFAGLRYRFYVGTPGSDSIVPREQHLNLLQPIIAPHVAEADIVVAGSGHLQVAQYQPTDLLSFFGRCLA